MTRDLIEPVCAELFGFHHIDASVVDLPDDTVGVVIPGPGLHARVLITVDDVWYISIEDPITGGCDAFSTLLRGPDARHVAEWARAVIRGFDLARHEHRYRQRLDTIWCFNCRSDASECKQIPTEQEQ